MIVEMLPHLRCIHLQTGIERSREGHCQAQQGGVERIDIVEMYNMCFVALNVPKGIARRENSNDTKENEDMVVAELRDELRDRVVGHHAGQEVGLACPAKGRTVVGQLHPHRVGIVRRYHVYVGHHEVGTLTHDKGVGRQSADILFGHLADERERVGLHHKVVVVGVVVRREERQGVDLPLTELESSMVAVMGLIAPRHQKSHRKHDEQLTKDFHSA